MSSVASCHCACHEVENTQVPGSAGVDAFTLTTADFVIPAIAATVNVSVGDNQWMAVGQKIFISDGSDVGTFEVQSFTGTTGVTVAFMGYTDDSSPGVTVGSGAKVSPSGVQQSITIPLPIADGGTGGTSKATAIAALGVGQSASVYTAAGIAYDITNTPAQITGVSVVVPSTGTYLVLACITVLYTGTTFASSRVLTLTVRNTTGGTNVVTCARDTGIFTTTNQPSVDYIIPFTTQSLTAAQNIQLYASLDTVESAGSSVITAASLCLLPIAI